MKQKDRILLYQEQITFFGNSGRALLEKALAKEKVLFKHCITESSERTSFPQSM